MAQELIGGASLEELEQKLMQPRIEAVDDEIQLNEIDSYQIDIKYPQREFQCRLGTHVVQDPVIATCCGQTSCLKCAVNYIKQTGNCPHCG